MITDTREAATNRATQTWARRLALGAVSRSVLHLQGSSLNHAMSEV